MSEKSCENCDKLKLENKKLLNSFKELNRYLCDGEHVDLCWVKDTVQLQAECETLVKAQHRMEIRKLEAQLRQANEKIASAWKCSFDQAEKNAQLEAKLKMAIELIEYADDMIEACEPYRFIKPRTEKFLKELEKENE